jgi:hypothetical protein
MHITLTLVMSYEDNFSLMTSYAHNFDPNAHKGYAHNFDYDDELCTYI